MKKIIQTIKLKDLREEELTRKEENLVRGGGKKLICACANGCSSVNNCTCVGSGIEVTHIGKAVREEIMLNSDGDILTYRNHQRDNQPSNGIITTM